MNVGVIGAGASGLMASYVAAKSGHTVTLFEHTAKLGKKILSTGGGKCNLSNTDMDLSHFHGDESFISAVMNAASKDDVLDLFNDMGLVTGVRNGYIYPYNEQASTVVDILKLSCEKAGVDIKYEINVNKVIKCTDSNDDRLTISTDKGDFLFDKVILCAGSKAACKTGSDGGGYKIAENLGHKIVKPLPALCGLKCEEKFFKQLQGIRCKADISIYIDGSIKGSDSGELQLTSYGLSGIPAMQLSHIASRSLDLGKKVYAHISFLKGMDLDQIKSFLQDRIVRCATYSAYEMLTGTVNNKIIPVILKQSKISPDDAACNLNKTQINDLCCNLCDFTVRVVGTNSFDEAQICCGGIDTNEVFASLESKLCKGLYFAGEILDVNGDCGGYNLQWAFSTGALAGGLKDA